MTIKTFRDGKKKRAPIPDGKTLFKIRDKTAAFTVHGVKYWCPTLTEVRVEVETPRKAWGSRIIHRFALSFKIHEGELDQVTSRKKWVCVKDDRLKFTMEVKQELAFDHIRLLDAASKAFAGSILGVEIEELRKEVAGVIAKAWISQWDGAENWHSAVLDSEEQATIVAVMEM
jgi:hypothetical protein